MAKMRGATVIDKERCKGCNLCVVSCPVGALALTAKEVNHKANNYSTEAVPDICTGCASCATVCPDGCITVYRIKTEQ